uniref:G_PROTEIN_RECEP_F1_2 domain-containing protein n=1 Tax=Ascaris lumbricoides TaxID=6252 RepID=A0A0M3IEP7_ASCLU
MNKTIYFQEQSVCRLQWFFGPPWLCDAWQLSDIILSTTSLYSICAIALDRVWNLEKPLRIFKRSRRIAKRLIFVIWILPAITWAPVYFILTNRTGNHIVCTLSEVQTSCCYTVWSRKYVVPIVAVPLLYIPAAILAISTCSSSTSIITSDEIFYHEY